MKVNNIIENNDGSANVELEVTNEENNKLLEYSVNNLLKDYINRYNLKENYKVMNLGNGMYRLACDCIDQDHDITFWYDYDKEFNIIELQFGMNFDYSTNSYYKNSFLLTKIFKNAWFRIKYSFVLLFKGYIKVYSDVIITNPDHIDSFINALYKSREWMEEYQKK